MLKATNSRAALSKRRFFAPAAVRSRAADARISDPALTHFLWPINVAQIDHDRRLHQRSNSPKVQRAEQIPLRQNNQHVGALASFIRPVLEIHAIEEAASLMALGIV